MPNLVGSGGLCRLLAAHAIQYSQPGESRDRSGFCFLLLPVYILPSLLTRGLTAAHRPKAACSPSLHCSVHPTLLGSPQSWSLRGDGAVLPAVTLQRAAASVCPQGKLLPLGPNFLHHQLLQKTTNNSLAGAPCSCYFSSHFPVGVGGPLQSIWRFLMLPAEL